ncbi:MAG: (Fe-S)-binding protein [Planctomycetaceae bacterium]|jgi:L-lactate dehydrogenase complex protein LldE|nr:(Fe-S)-binding protein [Planctomycetaceae bacterium]
MSDPVLRSYPKWDYPKYQQGETAALFIPCFIDQFFPSAGKAMVKLLENEGVPLEFPPEQTCCGQAAFNSGYWDEAKPVMEHFYEVFKSYKWIITPSTSCAAMARVFYEQLAPGSDAAKLGQRVFDISEFLVNCLGKTSFSPASAGAGKPKKVALHIGCHGRRELGIVEQPLTLLQNIPGVEYVPLNYMEECCGFGGTFSVKMPGTSIAMGKRKTENILASGCDVLATLDLSCVMHFGGIMRKDPAAKNIPLVHLVELLV